MVLTGNYAFEVKTKNLGIKFKRNRLRKSIIVSTVFKIRIIVKEGLSLVTSYDNLAMETLIGSR